MTPFVWFSEPALGKLAGRIVSGELTGTPGSVVDSASAIAGGNAVVFTDHTLLPQLADHKGPIVVLVSDPFVTSIAWLAQYQNVGHIVSASLLEQPLAELHIRNVMKTLASGKPRLLDWIDNELEGRRVRLSHASRRLDRLDKMTEFFTSKSVGSRTIEHLRDAAEELLTNAFYNAPVAAGVFDEPISREFDVALPDKYACDLAYGARDDFAIVRVKDPFGSLSRSRLMEVLMRCAKTGMQVKVDESMGGAGLGMWRMFTVATVIGVSVAKNKHTEILVGISAKRPNPRPYGIHLFFDEGERRRSWKRDESVRPGLNKSVLLSLTDLTET